MTEYVDGHRWPQKPVAPGTQDAPRPDGPDQRQVEGAPDSIRQLLHTPGVYIQADSDRCQVVICMDPDIARSIADHAPSPLQVELAAKLIDADLAISIEEQIETARDRQITGNRR